MEEWGEKFIEIKKKGKEYYCSRYDETFFDIVNALILQVGGGKVSPWFLRVFLFTPIYIPFGETFSITWK